MLDLPSENRHEITGREINAILSCLSDIDCVTEMITDASMKNELKLLADQDLQKRSRRTGHTGSGELTTTRAGLH